MILTTDIDDILRRQLGDDLRVAALDERAILLRLAPRESNLDRLEGWVGRQMISLQAHRVDAARGAAGLGAIPKILEEDRARAGRNFVHGLVVDHVPRLG